MAETVRKAYLLTCDQCGAGTLEIMWYVNPGTAAGPGWYVRCIICGDWIRPLPPGPPRAAAAGGDDAGNDH